MAIQVSPENVVGRDKLIEQIWTKLKKQGTGTSLRFTAERRIGKTTVMNKMAAEPMPGFEVLFLDLEGIDSPDRFTEVLLNRMRPLLSKKEQGTQWLNAFRETIGGTEIGGVIKLPSASKLGWQSTLEKAVEGLCKHQSDSSILLLFDELPYMLQKIAATSSEQKNLALAVLDTLRSLRQRHKNLRMVFAGSVGLHHVVTDLKQAKLASEPVNDMPMVEILALTSDDALLLANRLLHDESVRLAEEDAKAIPERLVTLTNCVPFYLEGVITRLAELDRDVTLVDVDLTVQQQLTSDHDPWEMEHFRSRLEIYYSGSITDANGHEIPNAAIARSLLDHFAVVDDPQSIEMAWSAIKAQFAITDRQHIVQMLKSLGQDHYLHCDTQKRYMFRFPLIQGWWKMAQGLEA
ncbi:hypothetical protein SAMN06265222_112100 [Neorhodopirellula lusitana]|uniref:Uncharacterized protein n=1 Tax=Neorhodopirellula lusitana TaxID=445327 RepID=A0ABY1QFH2_9BACT|nr:hypothetical protein [Neorhodopirellula lusitana]SMP69778.1 hypothetical protein SAMN06265222_112100 [Neorhodopirellula lusitana]